MNDIKATEKASEQKKKEAENEDKKASSSLIESVKHIFSILLLAIIVAVAAFPFVVPSKFDEFTYKLFSNFSDSTDISGSYRPAPVQNSPEDTQKNETEQLPVVVTETKTEPVSAPSPKIEEPSEILAEGFTLVEDNGDSEEIAENSVSEIKSDKERNTIPASETKPDKEEKITQGKDTAETINQTLNENENANSNQEEFKALAEEISKLRANDSLLEERVTSLEKLLAYSSFDSKRRALTVIAAMELQKAVQKGKNFQKELEKLYVLSSKDIQNKLDSLKPLTTKIKSDYALQQDFKTAMNSVARLPNQHDTDSFWAKVENIFRSLIVIRKTTDTDEDFQSKVNKANKLVNEYFFVEALAEISNAPTEAEIIFKPWKEEVTEKEAAKQIINEVLNDSLVNFGVFNTEENAMVKE